MFPSARKGLLIGKDVGMKVMEGTVSEVLSHSLSITNGLNILSCVCLLVMVC